MTFVNITALNFPAGMEQQVEISFANRRQTVDQEPGFVSFQLLRPVKGESRYFICTTWESREHYELWLAKRAENNADAKARQQNPDMSVDVMEFETVELA